jgi:sulfate adenylyltransferase
MEESLVNRKSELLVTSHLIPAYGDQLIDLVAAPLVAEELKARASYLPSVQLSERQTCDLELLATGAFSPLDRFMGSQDYERVIVEMRLTSGHLFPIPITLSVSPGPAIHLDREIALRDSRNMLLAVMRIEEVYGWDLAEAARAVFGTSDTRHPVVAEMHGWGRLNISGRMQVIGLPRHFDFRGLRLNPAQTRARLEALGRKNVVAFQTRNPLHRAHEELTKRAVRDLDGVLLLHPVVGISKPGDVDNYTRVRTYQVMVSDYYDADRVVLSLLPLAMRMAGPREALWHALIRRNFGANHMIIGRDHASPGADSEGLPFYPPYAAQELVEKFSAELGVKVVPFKEIVYLPDEERYEEIAKLDHGAHMLTLSASEMRQNYLDRGAPLPVWYTRPEVAQILASTYPPRHKQGVCVFLTGLSGAGKSTTAELLTVQLLERGRHATLLDGDVVRTHLSAGLGFSKQDRDANIHRMGFVAAEIVRHGGVCICAAVSPYRAARNDVRNMVGTSRFIEVFVDTPLEVCEQRDEKGVYAKARRGEVKNFTGISDPYETPQNAEIVLDTVNHQPEENALRIVGELIERGFIKIDWSNLD